MNSLNDNSTNTSRKHKRHFTLFDKTDSSIPGGGITYIIAFVIPLIIMTALYIAREIYPFGNNCYLRSDMYHQYAPFFSELWNKLRHGESLTYSWDIGMGTNFTALYAYYLASPSNWFIVLFPQKYMIEIMNVIIILKLCLSSLTFTYYISKHFNTRKCTIALFGMFYALSGFVAAYSWNIMWLDCLVLLPLIILGLERLVNENRCFLYCITLGLCIYTNYYIAIMVCISVVLYFIVLMAAYKGTRRPVIYVKKFLNFAIYSLLAGGLAACLLLPEFYAFTLSASNNIEFPKKLSLYFSILNIVTRHLINVPVHLGLDHYPNIYCSVAVLLLFPLYVMDKKVDLREKIGKSALVLIFLTAFNLNIPNFIWHGFHFPNSLPCRQSFIYVFFLLAMCYEALSHLKSMTTKQLGGALWIAIGILLFIEQIFAVDETYDFTIVYISGAFILVYALIMLIHLKHEFKVPVIIFIAFSLCIIECTINMDSTGIGTTSRSSYLLDYDAVKTVTQTVADDDSSFYRMDKKFGSRSNNDGAWHNYHSISTFSSTSNGAMEEFFGELGFEHSFNAYKYNGATLVTESLFSVKYAISNRILTESPLRSYYTGSDGEFIYKNNYTLPIGFMTYNDPYGWEADSANDAGIENQNSLIKNLTGISNVFTLTYENATDASFEVKPVKAGHLYMIVRNTSCDTVTATINSSEYTYKDLKKGRTIIDLGYATPDDIIVISGDTSMNASVYTLESSRFIEAFNILNNNSLNVSEFTNNKITGTVNASKDATLICSIPYDKGWSVYIDGKKTETNNIYGALISVNVPAGEHTVTLKYMPVNFILGCIITSLCIIILIGIYTFKKMCRMNVIKTSDWPVLIQELIDEKDVVLTIHLDNFSLDELDDFDNLDSDESNNAD
uniref:YfhO family protein n=1 Tax=Lachnospira sp. TaxID=2049031 RepID=UPI003FEFA906